MPSSRGSSLSSLERGQGNKKAKIARVETSETTRMGSSHSSDPPPDTRKVSFSSHSSKNETGGVGRNNTATTNTSSKRKLGSSVVSTRESTRQSLTERKEVKRLAYLYSSTRTGKNVQESSSVHFWTSRPALAMLSFCIASLVFRCVLFLWGALAIFLYQTMLVLSKWNLFVVHHPLVADCISYTKYMIGFGFAQVEIFLDENDRIRKAAVGLSYNQFINQLGNNVAGGYIRQRQKEVRKRTLEELQRLQGRLHHAEARLRHAVGVDDSHHNNNTLAALRADEISETSFGY